MNYNFQNFLSCRFLAKVGHQRRSCMRFGGQKQSHSYFVAHTFLFSWVNSLYWCGVAGRFYQVRILLHDEAYHLFLQDFHTIKVRVNEKWHGFRPTLWVPAHACGSQFVLAPPYSYGLNCMPPKTEKLKSLSWIPHIVTLIGKGVFAEIIKRKESGYGKP